MYRQIILNFIFITMIFGAGKAQTTDAEHLHDSCTEEKNMIIGKTTLDELKQNTEFWSEYLANYASYSADEKIIDEIDAVLKDKYLGLYVVAVIGTWCGDTKEQFPVFQKIIDNLQFNNINIEYIGVNRDKLAGEENISYLDIEFVPTFIFYELENVLENYQKIGRIVETPEDTMEKHILRIISKK